MEQTKHERSIPYHAAVGLETLAFELGSLVSALNAVHTAMESRDYAPESFLDGLLGISLCLQEKVEKMAALTDCIFAEGGPPAADGREAELLSWCRANGERYRRLVYLYAKNLNAEWGDFPENGGGQPA